MCNDPHRCLRQTQGQDKAKLNSVVEQGGFLNKARIHSGRCGMRLHARSGTQNDMRTQFPWQEGNTPEQAEPRFRADMKVWRTWQNVHSKQRQG